MNKRAEAIAKATGSVVAELGMVPNQTMMFHNDGKQRTEDDLIGYTADQFLKTGDPTWPVRNAMVKSAVRAMDTMTALLASEEGGERKVDRFVVGGVEAWLDDLADRSRRSARGGNHSDGHRRAEHGRLDETSLRGLRLLGVLMSVIMSTIKSCSERTIRE